MPTWVGWALAAGVLLVVVVALALKLRGKGPDVLKAGAKLIRKMHEAQAAATKEKINNLKDNFDSNAGTIKKLEDKLAKQREKLEADFNKEGLSAEEIAAEFAKLDL